MSKNLTVSVSVSVLALFALSRDALAISLPDNTSSCSAGDPCFKISSSVTNATTVWGNATGSGTTYGVFGYGYYGVKGQAKTGSNGTGVYGQGDPNGAGVGVLGSSTGASIGVAGQNNDATGIAGYFANSGGGWAGYFSGSTWTTGSYQSSDIRLKKEIKDVPYGLKQALELRAVTYQWKEGGDKGTQLGLIAQEVQPIVPEVVRQDPISGMLSVNYVGLIPVALKAIQDQQEIIKRQEKRITDLEQSRSSVKLSSMFGGGAALSLLPVGLILVYRRRKDQHQNT